jgi:methyl-accepting chemotaxis protein
MRRSGLRYKVSVTQAAMADGDAADKMTTELLQTLIKDDASEQRRQTYRSALATLADYQKKRSEFLPLAKQREDYRIKLFALGDQLSAEAAKLVLATRKSDNSEIDTAGNNVDDAILRTRLANLKFLTTSDPNGPAVYKTNSEAALAALDALEKLPLPNDMRSLIPPVRTALLGYGANYALESSAMLKTEDLFEKQMQPLLLPLVATLDTTEAAISKEFSASQTMTEQLINQTEATQKMVAGLALVLGGLLAWLVGRGIIRPIAGMTLAMSKLAAGETSVEVPLRDATDEMGAMAKAVEVFKQNSLERVRLEGEQKIQEEHAVEEKLTALRGMAEKIEAESGAALDAVGQRTAGMATTAEEMSASAARTGESAQAASAAAGQALANAQTVASAAEELAASIREIGGQVAQSTAVVGRAVAAGSETRATIETLNEQVGRIGVVADMISEIAAKTNLLALNATIEAARAGDAGKGFAVVASEVKQLATQTARSTEEISRHIGEVRAATGASVAAVGRIETTIGEINAISGSIAAAVEEQGAATAEIARNVTETAAAANEMTRRIGEVSSEAEQTGQRSAHVRDDAAGLNTLVGELKHSLIRVVRTSTAEVDRRQHMRHPVNLGCKLSASGVGTRAVKIADLSGGGAAISEGPALSIGTRGTLDIDRLGVPLPFTVRSNDDGMLHIAFDLDAASAGRLTNLLTQLGLQRAA